MARAKKRKSQARRKPAKPIPFNGDHGPKTAAATNGTVLEEIKNDDGSNPNNMARRRRKSAIEALTSLTMRQKQAAEKIQDSWSRLEMLGSGGPLKEKVQSSPKPDAVIDAQVAAQSQWVKVTKAILRHDKALVHWVCCLNQPLTAFKRTTGEARASERFKAAMDRVADHLGY